MQRSLAEEGETALSYHYLSEILSRLPDRVEDALQAQQQAADIAGDHPVFLAALGLRLHDAGKDVAALEVLEHALAIDPNCPLALPWALRLRRRFLRWTDEAQEEQALRTALQSGRLIDPLMLLSFIDDPEVQHAHAQPGSAVARTADHAPKAPRGKLRIGYFSADFREHATMHLIAGMLKAHDRTRFEFYVYDFLPQPQSRYHQLIRDFADVYHDISRIDDAEAVALARSDQLDIAVDLKGLTTDCRPVLFEHRVAPMQVSFLGFPGTTGIREIDFMIADPITIPAAAERFYNEQILRMPICYQPNDNTRPVPEAGNLRAKYDLPEDTFIFANFNHPHKVGPLEFRVWMDILRQVPDAVLLFYTGAHDLSVELARQARHHGIAPSRILPCGIMTQTAHIERLAQVDLCLDCFAYNAHTTASDALWAGVPLLTLCGRQFSARVATSILSAAGVPELSTHSLEDYVDQAVRLAVAPNEINALKQTLRRNRSSCALFDTKTWTRDYEDLLAGAYLHGASNSPTERRPGAV